MPTVLRVGPYRFFFYASDGAEPAHVYIERDAHVAKVWLDPVKVQDSGGFARSELSRIVMRVLEHRAALLRSWDDYFTN